MTCRSADGIERGTAIWSASGIPRSMAKTALSLPLMPGDLYYKWFLPDSLSWEGSGHEVPGISGLRSQETVLCTGEGPLHLGHVALEEGKGASEAWVRKD